MKALADPSAAPVHPWNHPDDGAALAADDQGVQRVILDLLAAEHQCGIGQPHIAGHPAIDGTLAGEHGDASGILVIHNHRKTRGSGMVCEDCAPDIGVILRTGMARQEGPPGHIGMTAGNGIPRR